MAFLILVLVIKPKISLLCVDLGLWKISLNWSRQFIHLDWENLIIFSWISLENYSKSDVDDEDARILVKIMIYQMVHALYDEKLLSRKVNLVAMNYNYNK